MAQIKSGAHGDGALTPTRADKFSFGLWTVGNSGRDQFGEATRARPDPNDSVRRRGLPARAYRRAVRQSRPNSRARAAIDQP